MSRRAWLSAIPLALLGLGCWWALIEGLLWLAGTITGGTL